MQEQHGKMGLCIAFYIKIGLKMQDSWVSFHKVWCNMDAKVFSFVQFHLNFLFLLSKPPKLKSLAYIISLARAL